MEIIKETISFNSTPNVLILQKKPPFLGVLTYPAEIVGCVVRPQITTLPFTYSLKRDTAANPFYIFISYIQSVPGSTGFAETLPDLSESPVVSPGGVGLVL